MLFKNLIYTPQQSLTPSPPAFTFPCGYRGVTEACLGGSFVAQKQIILHSLLPSPISQKELGERFNDMYFKKKMKTCLLLRDAVKIHQLTVNFQPDEERADSNKARDGMSSLEGNCRSLRVCPLPKPSAAIFMPGLTYPQTPTPEGSRLFRKPVGSKTSCPWPAFGVFLRMGPNIALQIYFIRAQ